MSEPTSIVILIGENDSQVTVQLVFLHQQSLTMMVILLHITKTLQSAYTSARHTSNGN